MRKFGIALALVPTILLGSTVFALAGFPVSLALYDRSSYESCRTCGTNRSREQAGIQFPFGLGRLPLSGGTRVDPSHAFRDLLQDVHRHEWESWGSSGRTSYGLYGSQFLGCGDATPPNRFVRSYEESEEFRSFVSAKLRSGELTRAATARIVALPVLLRTESEARKARQVYFEHFGEWPDPEPWELMLLEESEVRRPR